MALNLEYPEERAKAPAQSVRKDRDETEKLVGEAARGNRKALVALMHVIAKSVLFRVLRRVPNRSDAEDIAQEILLRVCDKVHTLKKPNAFGAWLNSIIVNETNRYLAKTAQRGVVLSLADYMESAEQEDEDFLPPEYVIREDVRRAVMGIVDTLPERQQEAVMLHYYHGMSVNETAEAMRITKQSASRYLAIARDKLKKELQNLEKKAPGMLGCALLPIGPLMAQIIKQNAVGITETAAWAEASVLEAQAYIGKLAGKMSRGARILESAATAAITLTAVTAAVLGLVAGGVIKPAETQRPVPAPTSAPARKEAQGHLIFTGGDAANAHLNPTGVIVQAWDDRGDLAILGWNITRSDGTLVHTGGGEPCEALGRLRDAGADGEYTLAFTLEDDAGATYILSRTFLVRAAQ